MMIIFLLLVGSGVVVTPIVSIHIINKSPRDLTNIYLTGDPNLIDMLAIGVESA
jgi:hypothetical protein